MARETREEAEMDTRGKLDDKTDSLSQSDLKLYETQFFGFTPQTCMLRVHSAFQDCLYDILPVVEKVCVRQLSKGESDVSEELLQSRARECSRKLQKMLEDRFKQLSDRMAPLLLSRCFSVPPSVVLPEDQPHDKYPQGTQELLRLESSVADLQTAYEAEVCARQALLAELEEQKEVQTQLQGILNWVTELQASWVKEGNSSFHENFQLAMVSIKKLQEAVREVYNKGPH